MIVIPMAGLSQRFFDAGYTKPKYMLPLGTETVFTKSVRSFEKYFATDTFLFVVRDVYETAFFVEQEVARLGIANFDICVLDRPTEGQAETVYLGIAGYNTSFPLLIFNIDTLRYHFEKPAFLEECDGYLEVFKGEGNHWSFIEPDGSKLVKRTTEKDRISDLCSDGLYYFRDSTFFISAFLQAKEKENTVRGEYYIAPLYNDLIQDGRAIFYDQVELEQIDFCGTPQEYQQLTLKIRDVQ